MRALSTDPEIEAVLGRDPVIAIGVSGGKDSQAAALAAFEHLDRIGHSGTRVLIHSDLGMVEWDASLPVCEDLARHLGVELITVRRAAGGMMERWEARWESSRRRYQALETVTLVLPWSTPAMRFCTSELKTQVIMSALKKRFKGETIVNVTGIRREESAARAKSIPSDFDARWSTGGTELWNWRPILDWTTPEVFDFIGSNGLELHPAYTKFGMTRVSCAFCIMSNSADMLAATTAEENHDLFRRMVDLEIASSFGFQGSRWLADVSPDLLSHAQRAAVIEAKERAAARIAIEKEVPKAVRLTRGKPQDRISMDDASALAAARGRIAELFDFDLAHPTAEAVHTHYASFFPSVTRQQAREDRAGNHGEPRLCLLPELGV